jgi:AAA+ superfamily predicted ATPase
MNEVIICVEVNDYWIKQQKEQGLIPFADAKDMIVKMYPEVVMRVFGNKLEIRNVTTAQNTNLRQLIKKYFSEKYQMSISDGDYNLTARICPGEEYTAHPEREKKEQKPQSVDDTNQTNGQDVNHDSLHNENSQNKNLDETLQDDYIIDVPELTSFLDEFDLILKNSKKFNLPSIVWSMNVLLSIDSGYGDTTICEKIADVLLKNGCVFKSKTQKMIIEYVIPSEIDIVDQYWAHMISEIEHFYMEEKNNGERSVNTPFIFHIDLSECLGKVDEKKFHENIYKLSKIKGSFIYVFRIPYIKSVAFEKIEESLKDVFLVESIVVAPYSKECLVTYLKSLLLKNNIHLEDGLDDQFEKLIALEKKDGRFNGLKTIHRLATDITYHRLTEVSNEEKISISQDWLLNQYQLRKSDDISVDEMLSQLYGMENVKKTIDSIVAQIQLYKELKDSGKKLSAPCMHMRFVGNPGTGKTTVARLIAQIFREKGILSKGYFYEIKARDLCGRYVGETAPKTSGYCKDALGSVLFIDEAYTLYSGKGRTDYGREAIETLITEMENNRDNLVVIMAGYKKEMDELLEMNSGLESRMPYEIVFRNYTKDELINIFYSMLGDNFTYTDGFDQAIRNFIYAIPDSMLNKEEFSNARMIRNLYERIWSKAAYRKSISKLSEITLQEEDVQMAITDEEFHQLLVDNKSKIGF